MFALQKSLVVRSQSCLIVFHFTLLVLLIFFLSFKWWRAVTAVVCCHAFWCVYEPMVLATGKNRTSAALISFGSRLLFLCIFCARVKGVADMVGESCVLTPRFCFGGV